MRFDFHVHVHHEGGGGDSISVEEFRALQEEVRIMSQAMDEMRAAVSENRAADLSIIAALDAVAARVVELSKGDPELLAFAAELRSSNAETAAAILRNTSAGMPLIPVDPTTGLPFVSPFASTDVSEAAVEWRRVHGISAAAVAADAETRRLATARAAAAASKAAPSTNVSPGGFVPPIGR